MKQIENQIEKDYFDWLCNSMYGGRIQVYTYNDLLLALYSTQFIPLLDKDFNRIDDGYDLRYRFAEDVCTKKIENMDLFNYYESSNKINMDIDQITDSLSSVGDFNLLEMLIALAIRCEEQFMSDPSYGNRTQQWFWNMITNLGLGEMRDGYFDEEQFNKIIKDFEEHRYTRDGKGSLFYVRNSPEDMRNLDIWNQLLIYINSIM
jgi:hypothetical protein